MNQMPKQSGSQRAARFLQPRLIPTVYPWAGAVLADGWDMERLERRARRDARREGE